jgi:FixJ family two-component response regulator
MSVGDAPTVFIIDDDSGARESIQDLVESVGLRAESFATTQQFLATITHTTHRSAARGVSLAITLA